MLHGVHKLLMKVSCRQVQIHVDEPNLRTKQKAKRHETDSHLHVEPLLRSFLEVPPLQNAGIQSCVIDPHLTEKTGWTPKIVLLTRFSDQRTSPGKERQELRSP
eukprot:5736594-Amphidinium_carterae.1